MQRIALVLALLAFSTVAAAKDKERPGPDAGLSASLLVLAARDMREKESCATAAPTYRVAAAMGAGQEAAQHELGECLLLMDGASPAETALFRQEGVFWLTRSAYAGNARAQRALALHYGARSNPYGSPLEALKWALVYEQNDEADVYGYKELPQTFVPGLKTDVPPEAVAEAEAFAASFAPVPFARFTPPDLQKFGPRLPPGGPPPGGKPPRR